MGNRSGVRGSLLGGGALALVSFSATNHHSGTWERQMERGEGRRVHTKTQLGEVTRYDN